MPGGYSKDYRASTKTMRHRGCGMSTDSQNKGVNRRLLLLSAWTAPVVASFALGGMQSAPRTFTGNTSVGSGAITRSANNLRPRSGASLAAPDSKLK